MSEKSREIDGNIFKDPFSAKSLPKGITTKRFGGSPLYDCIIHGTLNEIASSSVISPRHYVHHQLDAQITTLLIVDT